MKFRLVLFSMLVCCCGIASFAIPKNNYGTETCTQLVERANSYYEKGKYADARVLYKEALATGDGMFTKICTTRIKVIDNLLAGQKTNPQSTVFTISQDTVKINYLGGDYPIHVDGTNWKASTPGDDDWCKIEINRKSGTVKIYCSRNESVNNRSTCVTITNGNGKKKTVAVINEGSPEILRSSAQSLVFTPEGETSVVDIDANTDWVIAGVPGWLQAIKGRGDIQFTATPNVENKDRIAQVKIETPSRQEITINIIQGAALDSLAFSKNNLHFSPDGGDEYITVLTDADDWRFGDFPHWCQLERINDNTIHVHCTANEPVDMPREASVNVTTGTQTLGINVSQDPKPILHIIPVSGIGGRPISFGFNLGYNIPMINTGSGGSYTGSLVNYANSGSLENASYSSANGFSIGASVDIRVYKNLYLLTGLDYTYYSYNNKYVSGEIRNILTGASDYYFKGKLYDNYNEDYSFHILEIPILPSYRFPVTKTSHIRVNAGPVLSYGLSAKMKLSGSTDGENLKAYQMDKFGFTDNPAIGIEPLPYHIQANGSIDLYSNSVDYIVNYVGTNNGKRNQSQTFETSPLKRFNMGLRFGVAYEYSGISLGIDYTLMLTNMANKRFWDGKRWMIFDYPGSNLMSGYKQHNDYIQIHIGYMFRY